MRRFVTSHDMYGKTVFGDVGNPFDRTLAAADDPKEK